MELLLKKANCDTMERMCGQLLTMACTVGRDTKEAGSEMDASLGDDDVPHEVTQLATERWERLENIHTSLLEVALHLEQVAHHAKELLDADQKDG